MCGIAFNRGIQRGPTPPSLPLPPHYPPLPPMQAFADVVYAFSKSGICHEGLVDAVGEVAGRVLEGGEEEAGEEGKKAEVGGVGVPVGRMHGRVGVGGHSWGARRWLGSCYGSRVLKGF
jgi:hypothetical protein